MKEETIKKFAKWYIFLILLIFYVIIPKFTFRKLPVTPDRFLEMKFHYSPSKAQKILETYPFNLKLKYVYTALTVDYVYPIIYFLMFSILIYWIFRALRVSYKKIKIIMFLPFFQMIFDLFENISISTAIINLKTNPKPFLYIASFSTSLKWLFFFLTSFTILTTGIFLIFKNLKGLFFKIKN